MRQVSKEEFYGPIYEGRLNLHPSIVNDKFPYTSVFKWLVAPWREPYGKIVDRVEGGSVVRDYFVAD